MKAILDHSALSDRQLVELHLDGDRDAFRQIVERHQGMVCALGYSACGDLARSEDIAQEVFVAAWKQLPELREPEKLRSWIGGIARNMIHGAYRRSQRTPTARGEPLSAETPAAGASPSEQAVRSDEAALMWGALAGIPELYREPMVLFYRESQSLPAVAAALEISEDLVRQRLARGRAMLTARMAKLVEESLERSAPKPAFAGMVMLALPFGAAPAAIVAEAGALGGKAAAGGTLSKTAATVGAIGGAAAKGGAVIKFLSVVAFLPALLQGATDFIRFNERNATQTDAIARRQAAQAYLLMNAGIGMFFLGFMIFPGLAPEPNAPWVFGLIGLCAMAGIWMSVRAKCRLNRLQGNLAAEQAPRRGFEQRSVGTFLGLPFYHVRLGTRPTRRAPAVKGWIAISDGWAVGGLFAFGPVALGPLSMGVIGIGAVSVSVVAVGGAALGIAAAGWWGSGLAVAGGFAAKGIWACAPQFTSGASAWAVHAGDAAANAFFRTHWFFRFTKLSAEFLLWAGLLGWVMPLILTGWQLWRTRPARGK